MRPQVRAFHLPSEPWLFAIDRQGTVRAALEGAFGVDELTQAVKRGDGGMSEKTEKKAPDPELLESFAEEARRRCDVIAAGLATETNDFETLRAEAHALKGTAGAVGLRRLAELAGLMESDLAEAKKTGVIRGGRSHQIADAAKALAEGASRGRRGQGGAPRRGPLPGPALQRLSCMPTRVLVLGAGFGGLELVHHAVGGARRRGRRDRDRQERLVRLRVLEARRDVRAKAAAAVRLPYSDFAKPGVRLLRETVVSIDPEARSVTTDAGVHEADFLVVALGADYDMDATPGLAEDGNEFYSVAGAERVAGVLPEFSGGRVVIGVCGAPFKCPPAPSEAALLLHDYLSDRGIRDDSRSPS